MRAVDNMDDEMIRATPNERVYSAKSNYTIEFAKRTRLYAELYDQWDRLTSEVRRLRNSADSKESEATDIRKELEKAKASLAELTEAMPR